MRYAVGFFCAIICAGCGKATPTVTETSVAPKENPKVQVFKEKVAHYLEEARAGAKLFTLALTPSLDQVKAKSTQMTDLYTHLPDVPSEIDPTGKVANLLKDISIEFSIGEGILGVDKEIRRLGGDESGEKGQEGLKRVADGINKDADRVAAMVGL